jgi:hypothetical protein
MERHSGGRGPECCLVSEGGQALSLMGLWINVRLEMNWCQRIDEKMALNLFN